MISAAARGDWPSVDLFHPARARPRHSLAPASRNCLSALGSMPCIPLPGRAPPGHGQPVRSTDGPSKDRTVPDSVWGDHCSPISDTTICRRSRPSATTSITSAANCPARWRSGWSDCSRAPCRWLALSLVGRATDRSGAAGRGPVRARTAGRESGGAGASRGRASRDRHVPGARGRARAAMSRSDQPLAERPLTVLGDRIDKADNYHGKSRLPGFVRPRAVGSRFVNL
jgi:hypothetical protein